MDEIKMTINMEVIEDSLTVPEFMVEHFTVKRVIFVSHIILRQLHTDYKMEQNNLWKDWKIYDKEERIPNLNIVPRFSARMPDAQMSEVLLKFKCWPDPLYWLLFHDKFMVRFSVRPIGPILWSIPAFLQPGDKLIRNPQLYHSQVEANWKIYRKFITSKPGHMVHFSDSWQ